jgi:glutathione S-transferase
MAGGRPGVIVLWQFGPALGLPSASPFCIKAQTWLRLAGLEYEARNALTPRQAPLAKLPYVEVDGRKIADSGCIARELSAARGIDLDTALDARGRAVAHAFIRMAEEHLYWAVLYSRWLDPAHWEAMKRSFFAALPAVARGPVAKLVRRKVERDARGQGLALHDPEEIYRRGAADIAALADLLGERPYMMGTEASTLDASAYAMLASCWEAQLDTPLKAAVGQHPNLVAYCARMKLRCFS